MSDETTCAVCRAPIRQALRGRPRAFCSGRCRQRALELRRWADRLAEGFARDWESLGRRDVAEQIREEAGLVRAARYREALELRRAAQERQLEQARRAWSR
jgi:hypothetical protein